MAAGPEVTSNGSRTPADNAPVVPGRLPLLGHTMSLLGRRFRFLSSLRSHGEVVRIYLGPLPVYLVTSPELAWQVLVTNADRFDKGIISTSYARCSATAWPIRTEISTGDSAAWCSKHFTGNESPVTFPL